jgi:hypothetical protein
VEDEVTISNTAPEVSGVSISPDPPHDGVSLSCLADSATDADDEEVAFTYVWAVNSEDIGLTASVLAHDFFERDDTVQCTITPSDGTLEGTPVSSEAVIIGNAPPVVTSITLSPSEVWTHETIEVSDVTATDADGDSVTVASYAWYVDGEEVGVTTASLDGSVYFSRDQPITVQVTVNDGFDNSAPTESDPIGVLNSAPGIPLIDILPEDGEFGSHDLVCTIMEEAEDADGDAVSYTFDWEADGVPYEGTTTTTTWEGDTIPAEHAAEAVRSWLCRVYGDDGGLEGSHTQTSALARTQAISITTDGGCYITTDGTLSCWVSPWAAIAQPWADSCENFLGGVPLGEFVDVVVVGDGLPSGCALNVDGLVECWGTERLCASWGMVPESEQLSLSGTPIMSSRSGTSFCAVDTLGQPSCWGESGWWTYSDAVDGPPLPAEVQQIEVVGHGACGFDVDGTPICWGDEAVWACTDGSVAVGLTPGPSAVCWELETGDYSCCGTGPDWEGIGEDASDSWPTIAYPVYEGPFSSVALGSTVMCGVDVGGYVRCEGKVAAGLAYEDSSDVPECPTWEEGGVLGVDGVLSSDDRCTYLSTDLYGVVAQPTEPVFGVECSSPEVGSRPPYHAGLTFCCGFTAVGEPTCWGEVPALDDGPSSAWDSTLMNVLPADFVGVPEWLREQESALDSFGWYTE